MVGEPKKQRDDAWFWKEDGKKVVEEVDRFEKMDPLECSNWNGIETSLSPRGFVVVQSGIKCQEVHALESFDLWLKFESNF